MVPVGFKGVGNPAVVILGNLFSPFYRLQVTGVCTVAFVSKGLIWHGETCCSERLARPIAFQPPVECYLFRPVATDPSQERRVLSVRQATVIDM